MKYVITLFVLLTLVSCSKKQTCQRWKFYEVCYPKNSRIAGCSSTPPSDPSYYMEGGFCNDELNGVYPGAEKVLLDNSDVTVKRHFVNKVQ